MDAMHPVGNLVWVPLTQSVPQAQIIFHEHENFLLFEKAHFEVQQKTLS